MALTILIALSTDITLAHVEGDQARVARDGNRCGMLNATSTAEVWANFLAPVRDRQASVYSPYQYSNTLITGEHFPWPTKIPSSP